MALPMAAMPRAPCAQARAEPETTTLFRGWTRLTTDEHGAMRGAPLHGFFAGGTRFVTHYELTLDGKPVGHRLGAQLAANEWTTIGAVVHSGDAGDLPAGTLPRGSLELRLLRRVGDGWSELVIVRNNGAQPREVTLELALCCPILDGGLGQDSHQGHDLPRAGVTPRIADRDGALELRFRKSFGVRRHAPHRELAALYGDRAPADGDEVTRELTVTARVVGAGVRLHAQAGPVTTLRARLALAARDEVRLVVAYEPTIDDVRLAAPPLDGLDVPPRDARDRDAPRVTSSSASFDQVVGQAIADLASLELPIFGPSAVDADRHRAFIAGIPRYIGVFGRDNLVTARQAVLFAPARVEPVLSRLAVMQGVQRDDRRDEEPDRLLHERRLDPCAQVGDSNRDLYYGDVTATPFWILALAELYRWTGDRALLERQRRTLERCCDWVQRRLDAGDGVIYYAPSAAEHENRNQAWKDSGDGIVDDDGRVRVPPLAVCEVQGYAHQALREAAHLFEVLGTRRDDLRARASELKRRFGDRFWLAGDRRYALALDRDGAPVASIASNIGHCLGTSIIDDDKLPDVVRMLVADDMFSGWGVRTLSARNPAYDPFSYHRGSVWPAENAMIATGLRLRGFHDEAERITSAQLALAAMFEHQRLPEVFGGHARTPADPLPGLYSFANLLQAWSVSAIARHVQTLVGIWPRADRGAVYLDPRLPPWLASLEIRDVVVGGERLALRLQRGADGRTTWDVLEAPRSLELRAGIDHELA